MPFSDQALHRRAKKFLLRNEIDLFIPVLPGLEHVTAEEVRQYGHDIHTVHGGVELHGNLSTIYKANLLVRSGNYVLLRLDNFLSQSYPMLYDRARRVDWTAVLGNCPDISIHVTSRASRLNHKEGIRKVIFDAICQGLGEHSHKPRLAKNGLLHVHARIHQDRCTLSLNTSGEHLHRRGYRRHVTPAPLRETTAAGLLLLATSSSYDFLIDPFCGSGSFPIEAELIARNYPPGLQRRFAIEESPLHAVGTMRHAKKQALAGSLEHASQGIIGFDHSPNAIAAAKHNAIQAGTRGLRLEASDALAIDFGNLVPPGTKALIVSNLPFGKRLGTPSTARAVIEEFSEAIAQRARGWNFALLTPREHPIRHPDLVVDHTLDFLNSGIPVTFTLGHVTTR